MRLFHSFRTVLSASVYILLLICSNYCYGQQNNFRGKITYRLTSYLNDKEEVTMLVTKVYTDSTIINGTDDKGGYMVNYLYENKFKVVHPEFEREVPSDNKEGFPESLHDTSLNEKDTLNILGYKCINARGGEYKRSKHNRV